MMIKGISKNIKSNFVEWKNLCTINLFVGKASALQTYCSLFSLCVKVGTSRSNIILPCWVRCILYKRCFLSVWCTKWPNCIDLSTKQTRIECWWSFQFTFCQSYLWFWQPFMAYSKKQKSMNNQELVHTWPHPTNPWYSLAWILKTIIQLFSWHITNLFSLCLIFS